MFFSLNRHIKQILYSSFFLFLFFTLEGATIGSDTAPNRFTTQITLTDPTNRIAFFADIQGGFRIATPDASVNFDSTFPVSGPIDIHQGSLILDKDLITQNVTSFIPGNIVGNNNILEFAQTVTALTAAASTSGGCVPRTPVLRTLDLVSQVWSLDFSYDARFAAFVSFFVGSADNPGCYVDIYDVDFSDRDNPTIAIRDVSLIRLTTDDSNRMNLVRWHPERYIVAVALQSTTNNKELRIMSFDGDETFIDVPQALIPDEDNIERYAVSWHPSGNYLAVAQAASPYIQVYSFNQTTNELTGTVALSTTPYVTSPKALDWSLDGNYLAIGFDTSPYVHVLSFNPNPSTPAEGFSDAISPSGDNPPSSRVNSLRWHPSAPRLLAIATNGSISPSASVRVMEYNPIDETLTNFVQADEFSQVNSIDWSSCGNCLSAAYNTSSNNHATFLFRQNPPTLESESVITTIAQPLTETRYNALGQGLVDCSNQSPSVSLMGLLASCCLTIRDLTLRLTTDLLLDAVCLIFQGNCTISGSNKHLVLSPFCSVQVAPNSTLTIKNTHIDNLGEIKILCSSESSKLILDTVSARLNENYIFSLGSLDCKNKVSIYGENHSFVFSTNQPCIIAPHSQLELGNNLTFNYTPPNNSATLLRCADQSSTLALFGAHLFAIAPLTLTKGIVTVDRAATLSGPGAITIGDGISEENNTAIQLLPAAQLINSGNLIYQNI